MHSTPRVLIVESGDSIGRLMAVALYQEGYEVIQATNLRSVTRQVSTLKPDLILFNTGMGSAEKSRYIERWRRLSPTSRVIELGYSLLRPGVGTEDGTPDAYQTYPFRIENLLEKIHKVVNRETEKV